MWIRIFCWRNMFRQDYLYQVAFMIHLFNLSKWSSLLLGYFYKWTILTSLAFQICCIWNRSARKGLTWISLGCSRSNQMSKPCLLRNRRRWKRKNHFCFRDYSKPIDNLLTLCPVMTCMCQVGLLVKYLRAWNSLLPEASQFFRRLQALLEKRCETWSKIQETLTCRSLVISKG